MKTKPNIVLYQTKGGEIAFRADIKKDTVWENLNQIAELFGRDKSVISQHIRNVFKSGELSPQATIAKIVTVQREGDRQVSHEIEYYNLDLILSVGYRVDSKQATQFRQWATRILRQHLLCAATPLTKNARGKAIKNSCVRWRM